ncbi:ribosomal protein S18-alanine N-acetyltransferase [Acetohalobium arabaticum]|uniref:Ribosomal-protein-alanine acetyltransferase n=1 Tax=Acetohalobium arabaticum (strain ATCC 49924 / DSM 5501 / Z-7288) TaxID=574087 RepID=D9QT79_ACEAZ|nr:ribosomal protein S18-alanine N-acetyltransferase [Acetohalobium arabaticum]ADL13579.1 ribosomal-protein-alanine acetyltransferase [Acetohalobium arabaticum DSM 5501]
MIFDPVDLVLQPMQLADLERVIEIEEESFGSPWSVESFKKELTKNRYAHYLVLKKGAELIGYIGIWIFISEGHITTLAIAPAYRRQGLAKYLLDRIVSSLAESKVRKVTLEVRVSNQAARRLYRDYGFEEVGIKEDYYQNNQEDAVVMHKVLDKELD